MQHKTWIILLAKIYDRFYGWFDQIFFQHNIYIYGWMCVCVWRACGFLCPNTTSINYYVYIIWCDTIWNCIKVGIKMVFLSINFFLLLCTVHSKKIAGRLAVTITVWRYFSIRPTRKWAERNKNGTIGCDHGLKYLLAQ